MELRSSYPQLALVVAIDKQKAIVFDDVHFDLFVDVVLSLDRRNKHANRESGKREGSCKAQFGRSWEGAGVVAEIKPWCSGGHWWSGL